MIRALRGQQFARAVAQPAQLGAIGRLDQGFPGREVAMESADAHAPDTGALT